MSLVARRIQSAEGTGDDKLIDADVAELLGETTAHCLPCPRYLID